ncbi:hypothetical protein [Hymenobacter sp. YC55]|uniref:hypothetical protein n=1 Tax=Hymenobacter sp. YC55 TaxID=3034019 RepID=UPI0023F8F9ED|nr:hypothetical protein [Hymenobacter sp. YC55]MDF7814204.1 hypothetical protein [Hymenobacter sp. YC55]
MTTPNPAAVTAAQPLDINREALLAVARTLPPDQPVLMLNLLRYRAQADFGPNSTQAPCSGQEAYQAYIQAFLAHNSPEEAKVFFHGATLATLVAPAGELWDDIALVEYRNLAVFRRWVENPVYATVAEPIRQAALADWRLLMTQPMAGQASFQ